MLQYPPSFILMYLVFPLWVAAGFADWVCHRRTAIALTSGLKENLLHWLMFAQIGLGMLAVALLELNAAVLLIVFLVFVVHEFTVFWDLSYSTLRRDVGPFEQMVHSFLEILPLLSLCLLAAVLWEAQAPAGLGNSSADWTLRPKREPLPDLYLWVALALVVSFNAIPLLQETWACVRARAKREPRSRANNDNVPARREPELKPGPMPVHDPRKEPTVRTPPNLGPR